MNDLHNAYATLGVPLGSSMETITRRYKRLIMVWHPDRAHTPEQKEFAEEELKKINNAKDLLTKHFGANGGHKASGCNCQPGATTSSGTGGRASSTGSAGPGPGPAYHRNKSTEEKYQEEQAAKKRDADRKAREEAEANAKRAQEQYKQQTSQKTMDTAMQQQAALQDEKLRWKISIGIVIAFIVLEIFGSMTVGAKHWVQDTTRNWKWPTFQSEKPADTTPPIVISDTPPVTIPDTTPVPITPVEVKEDPCSLPNPSSTPPKVILPNLHNWVRQAVTQWSVNCQGDSSGTITGRDEKGRLVVSQEYGKDWSIIQQWTFNYGWAGSGETVTVDLYKPAFDFVGRSIYAYDQDHNVIEIRQQDGHQRAIVTATIQRRPGGAYYQTILKFFELATGSMTDTKVLSDANDPYMSSTFYQYGMLGGSTPKTVTSDPLSPIVTDDFMKRYGLDKPSTGLENKNYTSPFASPADPNNSLLTPSTTPSSLRKKYGLDGLSTPSTTTPSLSELLNKTQTTPTTKSFFDKKYGGLDGLSTPSSSTSNLSDLLKKYKSSQPTTSSPSGGGP